jgi:hypothetical protein
MPGLISQFLADDHHVALRAILAVHNTVEEGPEGVYEQCEHVAGEEVGTLLAQLRAAPDVRVSAYTDGPRVLEAIRRALTRAGYDFAV